MIYPRIDNTIEVIRKHIENIGAPDLEINSYLTSYLVTIIYSEYEARLNILVARRCSLTKDKYLKNFAQALARCGSELNQHENGRKAGKIKVGDIAAILKKFGETYRVNFMQQIENTPAHSAWDQIISNRISVAHQQGLSLTFEELTKSYRESCKVLDSVAAALELPKDQLADL